jgi:NitT/TauT family transport system substrate-binding protein
MKTALSGYLEVLYDQDPTSVGGALPADDFYYLSKQN